MNGAVCTCLHTPSPLDRNICSLAIANMVGSLIGGSATHYLLLLEVVPFCIVCKLTTVVFDLY